jgi:hypothetical protein
MRVASRAAGGVDVGTRDQGVLVGGDGREPPVDVDDDSTSFAGRDRRGKVPPPWPSEPPRSTPGILVNRVAKTATEFTKKPGVGA